MLALWPQRGRLDTLVSTDILGTLMISKSLALQMLGAVVAILAFVAADDLFQYRQWYERQKMVRKLKEEYKLSEIRQIRMADPLCRRAAIRARHECADLPRHGSRATALKIREVAQAHLSRWWIIRRSLALFSPDRGR